jgi:16S rRNA (guanine527-N7)-methyltransferase
MADDERLAAVLATNRAHGSVGEQSLDFAIAHADRYVECVPSDASTLIDLGSGGGLPGLVIAVRLPDLAVTLVERRTNRADQLARSVRALGLTNVTVRAEDVSQTAQSCGAAFDVVTARSFAAPPIAARWAATFLRPGGLLLVSNPPVDGDERWNPALLMEHGLDAVHVMNGIRVMQRHDGV